MKTSLINVIVKLKTGNKKGVVEKQELLYDYKMLNIHRLAMRCTSLT